MFTYFDKCQAFAVIPFRYCRKLLPTYHSPGDTCSLEYATDGYNTTSGKQVAHKVESFYQYEEMNIRLMSLEGLETFYVVFVFM